MRDKKEFLGLVIRIAAGTLFIYSGFTKLISPREYFEISINLYDMMPGWGSMIFSHVLPWLELIFGTYVLVGYQLSYSSYILAGLCFLFQIALGQAVMRRLSFDDCGCFGRGDRHLTLYQSFALDTLLTLLLIYLSTLEQYRYSLDSWFAKKLSKNE